MQANVLRFLSMQEWDRDRQVPRYKARWQLTRMSSLHHVSSRDKLRWLVLAANIFMSHFAGLRLWNKYWSIRQGSQSVHLSSSPSLVLFHPSRPNTFTSHQFPDLVVYCPDSAPTQSKPVSSSLFSQYWFWCFKQDSLCCFSSASPQSPFVPIPTARTVQPRFKTRPEQLQSYGLNCRHSEKGQRSLLLLHLSPFC